MAIRGELLRQKMAEYAHHAVNVGVKVGQEITLCVTSGALLHLASHYLSKGQKKVSRDLTRWCVVVAPIVEEIIYRGVIQHIVGSTLKEILPSNPQEEDEQEVDGKDFWRVALRSRACLPN